MPNRLRPAAMSLADLLGHYRSFRVPEYQRVYAWGEHQVGLLLSALEAASEGAEQEAGHWLYLGTIYLAVADDGQDAEIADGQQRILTATMLYAAGRDLADDPLEAERLHRVLVAPGASAEAPMFRFVPRAVDAAFFRRAVQEQGATLHALHGDSADADAGCSDDLDAIISESQRHIIANRDMIVAKLAELGAARRRALFRALAAATELVAIVAPTLEEARIGYASTQTRGLRQAEADKLKAELIGDCPRAVRARLAGRWEECEASLGQDNLAELLQHMLVIRCERKSQPALDVDLFRAFELPKEAEAFIERELVPSALAYRRICGLQQARRRPGRVEGYLTTLLRATHDGWKAPALVALRSIEDPGALEGLLGALERLAAVMMIVGLDPNEMTARYVAVLRDIKAGHGGASKALQPSAAELARARECLRERRFAQRDRFRMPLLLKLNDLMARSVQAVDPRTVSCEHILPRNAPNRSPWRQVFHDVGRKRYLGGNYVHSLGNLAILTHQENRCADTLPFSEKRVILKRSAFALSNDAARVKAWTPEAVAQRTERLAQMLIAHWRLAPR
jgi:hypothetical protein